MGMLPATHKAVRADARRKLRGRPASAAAGGGGRAVLASRHGEQAVLEGDDGRSYWGRGAPRETLLLIPTKRPALRRPRSAAPIWSPVALGTPPPPRAPAERDTV